MILLDELTKEQRHFLEENPDARQQFHTALEKYGAKTAIAYLRSRMAPAKGLVNSRQISKTVAYLEAAGVPFTINRVAELAGCGWEYIGKRPYLKQLCDEAINRTAANWQYKPIPANESEARCLQAIKDLEAEGRPFTKYQICKRAGVAGAYLTRNKRMRQLAESAIDRTLTRLHKQSWEAS